MSRREVCTVVMMCAAGVSMIVGIAAHELTSTVCGASMMVFAGCYEIATAIREK